MTIKRDSSKALRWLPALVALPIAVGTFGVATSWAITHDPLASTSDSAAADSNQISSAQQTQIDANKLTITALETKLSNLTSQIKAMEEATAALLGGSPSNSSSSWSGSSSASSGSAAQQAPAPTPAPAPAPSTNTKTGAS